MGAALADYRAEVDERFQRAEDWIRRVASRTDAVYGHLEFVVEGGEAMEQKNLEIVEGQTGANAQGRWNDFKKAFPAELGAELVQQLSLDPAGWETVTYALPAD